MKRWKMYIMQFIWGPLILVQFILVFFFGMYNEASLDSIMYIGWMIWAISIILGWLPIFIFKKKGGVPKGKSFVHTTVLVDSGLYSIIRHPQYTAGILLSLALVLISQNIIITIMGIFIISLLYLDILIADKHELEKFGDEYRYYMKEVPRTNFILGIYRRFVRRRKGNNKKKLAIDES